LHRQLEKKSQRLPSEILLGAVAYGAIINHCQSKQLLNSPAEQCFKIKSPHQ
jgi:hypothetical protein